MRLSGQSCVAIKDWEGKVRQFSSYLTVGVSTSPAQVVQRSPLTSSNFQIELLLDSHRVLSSTQTIMCGSCGGGGSPNMSSPPPACCPPQCCPPCPSGPCCSQPITLNAIICRDPYECSPRPVLIPLRICGFGTKPGPGGPC